MRNPISLEQLTITDVTPLELVEIASALKCQHVSLFVRPRDRPPEWFPIVTDHVLKRELRNRMAACGITPFTIDYFHLSPDVDVDSYSPALECAAELGARQLSVLVFDADENRRADAFGRLCDRAAERGLGVTAEFVPRLKLRTLSDALRLVKGVNRANAGITVDALHMIRSGSSIAELVAIDPRYVNLAHFCDGPLTRPREEQEQESLCERMIPGAGQFPLLDFAAAVPPGVPIGVEVPQKSLSDQGVPPLERARRAVDATRAVLSKVWANAS